MCVVPERGPLCRRDTRGAWFRPNARCAGVVPGWCGRWMLVATQMACRAAEHIVQAEAATRPRDRAFFDAQNRLERDPDLSVAAPLNSTVGPLSIAKAKCHEYPYLLVGYATISRTLYIA